MEERFVSSEEVGGSIPLESMISVFAAINIYKMDVVKAHRYRLTDQRLIKD